MDSDTADRLQVTDPFSVIFRSSKQNVILIGSLMMIFLLVPTDLLKDSIVWHLSHTPQKIFVDSLGHEQLQKSENKYKKHFGI